ncbi:MAG: glycosyltransferase family 2 protein [Ferruginibacter sp.]
MLLPGISVVIPNYNGRQLLPEIIPYALKALQHTNLASEIIIVDDCSTDDSCSFIATNFPGVVLIKNEINSGFSITMNRGIFSARFQLMLMLNSDVKLEANYFTSLLPYFLEQDCFGVMGRIVGWNDDNIQDAAKLPAWHGAKLKTSGNYFAAKPAPGDRLFSMYLSGANALVSTEKLLFLGGFDELFSPFYIEDVELSIRAWRVGWKCYYDHFAICRHKVSTSIKSSRSKNFIKTIYYRNKMFLHAKHLEGTALLLWYMQLVPEAFIKIVSIRRYYFRALRMFSINKRALKTSRNKFEELADENLKTLSSVTKIITDSIQGRKVIKF